LREALEKATDKQVKILAVCNITGAKLFEIVEALDGSNWDVDQASELIFENRLKGEKRW
jgi:hypothetical protein